ncbi:hypothetical protein SAMN05444354_101813 [Stigmatella aurantiaca]|uniref:Uncharacterized protein n=1 Tax=Stigmatella aurantiaca TaxID=41 RepID=A0A1H7HWI9_STIAU|nr:hypothetical protein SAMN05444354_101813 [Stigmatella aurantiaca]
MGTGAKPTLQLDPDPEHGKAFRAAEVNLDDRGQLDLYIVFPSDFGSDGATVQALYAHCSGDRYAPVWGPEYTLGLTVQDSRTNGWRDVVRSEKAGAPENPSVKRFTLHFQGGMYQDAPME